ncbi:hypothetical protein OG407_00150 [Streptomyces sp. NBC_01515]|uniref:hypothetical protein n=1 Tax=Streptomyces sp. NBC_01515 TaxID=2903890 RepID=UPI0038645D88
MSVSVSGDSRASGAIRQEPSGAEASTSARRDPSRTSSSARAPAPPAGRGL